MKAMLVVVLLAGCAPLDGTTCETLDEQRCDGADVAFCETTSLGGKKWKTYDCPSGCDAVAAQKCDWKGVAAGAECPRDGARGVPCPADGRAMSCNLASKWEEIPCAACQAGKRLEDTGADCSSGVCRCG